MYKLETVPARTGKRLTCICGYSWIYLGSRKYIASCPRCHSSVTIESKRKKTRESIIDRKKPLMTPEKVRSPAGLSPKAEARATAYDRAKEQVV